MLDVAEGDSDVTKGRLCVGMRSVFGTQAVLLLAVQRYGYCRYVFCDRATACRRGYLRLNEQLCLGNKLREGSRYCSCQTKDGITGYGRTEYLKRHED